MWLIPPRDPLRAFLLCVLRVLRVLRVPRAPTGDPVIGSVSVGATFLSYALGWAIGIPLLVPALNTAAAFPFMVAALKRGDLPLAIARMLVWALTLAICATLLSYAQPSRTDTLFLRGAAY